MSISSSAVTLLGIPIAYLILFVLCMIFLIYVVHFMKRKYILKSAVNDGSFFDIFPTTM